MIKNIIFDFDGVLVDSEILVAKAMRKYLAEKNITFAEKEYSKFAGKKTFQVISELSSLFNIPDKQSFFNDIMSLANSMYSNELQPVFGATNFLKNTNHNRFIGSNSPKERILKGLKIAGIHMLMIFLYKCHKKIMHHVKMKLYCSFIFIKK